MSNAGRTSDAPWGRTLASFAIERRTGELVVRSEDGKEHRVAWIDGMVVAASSPLAADSVARIALTGHFVTPTHVSQLKRLPTGTVDEIEFVANVGHLSPEQKAKLRQRVMTHRTARTFTIENGEWFYDPSITLHTAPGVDIDVGAAILLGAQQHVSELRLLQDLKRLGSRFKLAPDAEVARFGFTPVELPILDSLRAGATLPELDAKHRDIVPRTQQAVVYAVAVMGACEPSGDPVELDVEARTRTSEWQPETPTMRKTPVPAPTRTHTIEPPVRKVAVTDIPTRNVTPRHRTTGGSPENARAASATLEPGASGSFESSPTAPAIPRTLTPPSPSLAAATPPFQPRAATAGPAIPRTFTPPSPPLASATPTRAVVQPRAPTARASTPAIPRTLTPSSPTLGSPTPGRASTPAVPRTITPRRDAQIRETVAKGLALLDSGADYYALLEVKRNASVDTIRLAYLGFASLLHKNKLPVLDEDTLRNAQRLFSEINTAFGVLSDPVRRADYDTHPKEKFAEGSSVNDNSKRSDQEFQRGLRALKREDLAEAIDALSNATMLSPQDVDAAAMLAWARFCATSDKDAIAPSVRKALERAVVKSNNPMTARFYLGRVERMLGRLPQALHHFRVVVDEEPGHSDAAAEIRMLEQRVGRR